MFLGKKIIYKKWNHIDVQYLQLSDPKLLLQTEALDQSQHRNYTIVQSCNENNKFQLKSGASETLV